jgi:hypothetical protein
MRPSGGKNAGSARLPDGAEGSIWMPATSPMATRAALGPEADQLAQPALGGDRGGGDARGRPWRLAQRIGGDDHREHAGRLGVGDAVLGAIAGRRQGRRRPVRDEAAMARAVSGSVGGARSAPATGCAAGRGDHARGKRTQRPRPDREKIRSPASGMIGPQSWRQRQRDRLRRPRSWGRWRSDANAAAPCRYASETCRTPAPRRRCRRAGLDGAGRPSSPAARSRSGRHRRHPAARSHKTRSSG